MTDNVTLVWAMIILSFSLMGVIIALIVNIPLSKKKKDNLKQFFNGGAGVRFGPATGSP